MGGCGCVCVWGGGGRPPLFVYLVFLPHPGHSRPSLQAALNLCAQLYRWRLPRDFPASGLFLPAFSHAIQDWGKCNEGFIVGGGFCKKTCGRCSAGSPAGSPASTAFSSSPSPSPSPSPSQPSQAGCTDTPPDGSATCAQRKQWGQCWDWYLTSSNACAATCGRCQQGGGKAGSRKLLRGPLRA